MWLDSFFANKLMQDIVATAITLAAALTWLRVVDFLAHRGLLEQKLSRKIIHIGTGPLYVACWNLFSAEPHARWLAALVPLGITLQFIAVGLGWMKDEAAVKAMTRHNDPREILRGPLYYGLIFVVCTLIFWRTSPVGIFALMALCGGDGLADIVGRRLGAVKLPFNPQKSWAGSAAMWAGSFLLGWAFVAWFGALGYFSAPPAPGTMALIALACTVVEMLPLSDVDNLTITLTAIGLGLWWL